jgi:hypothetical protein
MSKKKAIICTVLLMVVVCAAILVISFIDVDLCRNIFALMAGAWTADKLEDFYEWLINRK